MVAYQVITVVIMVLTAWIGALRCAQSAGARPIVVAWMRGPGRCAPAGAHVDKGGPL